MSRTHVLSARQMAILRLIGDWIIERGEAPTVRGIEAWVGLSSTRSVACQLGRLEARGPISRTGHRWCPSRLCA
ncbi:hypothetical protein [Streptomyces sp. NPDC102282]|uniref:LexA family protein n=1 Tax=Streptomyces sp. NPDC102282 TaxID=3366154 RepID=UPI0038133FE3